MRPWEKHAILFLLKHLATGAVGAIVLATGILVMNVAGIGALVANSEHGIIAAIMLYVSLILTFGSVAMGIGVMALNEDTRP
jgi:polyferredoxin